MDSVKQPATVESCESEKYTKWVAAFQVAADKYLNTLQTKSYFEQAYGSLNGFWKHLNAYEKENVGKTAAEIVDGYFAFGIYAESTERLYRRWIRRVIDLMEGRDATSE
jgi:hypothetical protein